MDIEQLLGAMHGDADEKPKEDLTDLQVINRLRGVFEKLSEPQEMFSPGDVIVHKFPTYSTTRGAEKPALVFSLLDEPISAIDAPFWEISDLGGSGSTRILDMKILILHEGCISIYYATSNEYRLYSEAE